MKKLLAVLLVLAMVLSFAACAAPVEEPVDDPAEQPVEEPVEEPVAEDDKVLDIGVLVWKYDDAYGSTVRAAMEKYAVEIGTEMGYTINLTMQDANDSMATQNDQADIMFGSKPDFVIINLAEVASGQSLVDKATAAGVPFLFYNKEPVDSKVITEPGSIFIGTTPREAGDMQGEILADLLAADPTIDKNGDGKIQYLMFMGEPNNPEAIARSEFSVKTAEANGVVFEQLGETLVCDWDQAKATDAMTAAFASFGGENIEVIFANNDMMGLGAIAALNANGYNTGVAGDPNIVVIGVDAVDAALEAIKAGKMTATVQQDGDAMGKACIRIAINGALGLDWLDGTDYEISPDGYSVRIPYAKITD